MLPRHLAALRSHLESHAPWGAQVTVTPGDVGQPYAIAATGPVYEAARAAFTTAWGREPVEMGMGGSIPFIAEFAAAFPAATILVTGVEDPGTQAHSVNESLDLGVLRVRRPPRRCYWRRWVLRHQPLPGSDRQVAAELGDVSSGLDVVLGEADLPVSSTRNVDRMTP